MSHIHTQPGNHDLTVSAYIVRTDVADSKILLHMHKVLKGWMQIGGHVELHETPWAAIKREIMEESGYNIDQLRILQPSHSVKDFGDASVAHPMPFLFGTHPYGDDTTHFHTDLAFVFTAKEKPRHELGEDESTQLQLFTRQEIVNMPPEQMVQNVRVAVLYIFDRLLGQWTPEDPSQYKD